jgi:hypothetical protein
MVHGSWLSPERLKTLHQELVDKYRTPAWEAPIDLSEPRTLQYQITDNGAVVGAYAIARQIGGWTEKQTLEDETITAHVHGHALTLDVERPEGTVHAEHANALDYLTPASAYALVDNLPIAVGEKTTLAVNQPDGDAPKVLRRGTLMIERLPPTKDTERIYRLRLAIDRVAVAARITLEGEGLPYSFKISSTTRPVLRTYTRTKN